MPEVQHERLRVAKSLLNMDPAFPPHRKGDQKHTGCSGQGVTLATGEGWEKKNMGWTLQEAECHPREHILDFRRMNSQPNLRGLVTCSK